MLLSTRGGVPKVAGEALGGSMIKMGNGAKFKLSSVLPNVFSKIKGIRRNSSVHKLSSSVSVTSECAASDMDQKDFSILSRECSASEFDRKDFSIISRDAHGDRSPSPKRSFRQNKNGHGRHTSSPVLTSRNEHETICFPPESPIKTKGSNKSGSLSPPPPRILGSAEIVDPGCWSFDSTMALVPHDGRVRRAAPQAVGKCLIMSKCSSFNGSTQHSDSEISETDSSTTLARIRHSRARSAQLEGSSSCEGYRRPNTADERAGHGSGKVSVRRRSSERRDQNAKMEDQRHQLYGGSSPIHPARGVYGTSNVAAKYCRADHNRDGSSNCRGSGRLLDSSREGTDLDRDQTNCSSRHGGHLSRKLSFTNDNNARAFDDTSFSSDDDFYTVVTSDGNVRRGHHRSRSTSTANNSQRHMHGGKQVTDLDYTSSEAVYTQDERNYAKAFLRRETLLPKTVLKASDGWAKDQLSRFSHREEKVPRRASYDSAADREATLVKTVLNSQGWARENLRALAKANDLDPQTLAKLKADILVRREEDAADKIEYETFGLNPDSREFFSWKNSRHPSPISEEVEKYTEGRVDYKSNAVNEECAQPVPDYASDLYKGARTGKSGKEFGKPWDTEFPSFRSDSILMGGGINSDRTKMPDERPALIDCTQCGSPAPITPRYLERQRQSKIRVGQQQQDPRNCGKMSSLAPSSGEEVMSVCSVKNCKPSSQSASPRVSSPRLSSPRLSSNELSGRPKRSPSSFQETINGKKMPSRTPSPSQEVKGARRSTSLTTSLVQDFQQAKTKSSRTLSPARSQSPRAGGKPLTEKAETGMQRLDSVAVVKASYDPYQDFRQSMVEMILENEIRTSEDLEDLLQCYLSLNSSEYHKIIVEVFTDVWGDIFDQ